MSSCTVTYLNSDYYRCFVMRSLIALGPLEIDMRLIDRRKVVSKETYAMPGGTPRISSNGVVLPFKKMKVGL